MSLIAPEDPDFRNPSMSSSTFATSSSASTTSSPMSSSVIVDLTQPAIDRQDETLLGFTIMGNKCGRCQNHDVERSKKGHARDCPFKKCECLKCRLLDARSSTEKLIQISDILQVISGKETKLKGTKKDPHCGFCQNHNIKILRKGHVRSCEFGQERHFKEDNCFDCEVHYIRNEVNRLQIKMRRAMKEDRTLSEEQKKTAREAITRDEVEKVCDMARMARRKRNAALATQQVSGDLLAPKATIQQQQTPCNSLQSHSSTSSAIVVKRELNTYDGLDTVAQDGPPGLDYVASSRPMPAILMPHHHQQLQFQPAHDSDQSSQSDLDEEPNRMDSGKHVRKRQKCWRPWKELIAGAQARQLTNQQNQLHSIELQDPASKSDLQLISQTRSPAQLQGIDDTMRRSPSFDSMNGLFNRSADNSNPTHRPIQSIPELQQPVDLHCAMQRPGCSTGVQPPPSSPPTDPISSLHFSNTRANNNFLIPTPQDQPLSLVPLYNREQQFLNTIHLFRLMLQFSAQNQRLN